MHLTLDTARMRAAMTLWRQEATLARRPDDAALASLASRVGGWLDLLRLCTPGPDDSGEFQVIVGELEQLREWAHESLAALRLLSQLGAR